MGKNIRECIEYQGINAYSYDNLSYFNQINIDFRCAIPVYSPEVKQIIKVCVSSKIEEKRVIKTPRGVSLEGQKTTGHKLMIVGNLWYRLEYVSNDAADGIYKNNAKIPFYGYVVLPEKLDGKNIRNTTALIEDIYSEKLDCREVYNNITMMLVADLC
ncbi:MAG: SPOCS domain-containing protein [Cellulosilyticaceae bacterium]